MSLIYGVNSITPSNVRLTNGYTLYDWVMRQSCFPSFWGRTLVGNKKITSEEIEFLKSKNCKLVLIVRDLDELKISGNNGTDEALVAIKAAKTIGVLPNTGKAIFAEIPSDYSVNHNWMLKFSRTLVANGYVPGFIGNTDSSMNFNFDRQCSHYVQAVKVNRPFDSIYWSTEPRYEFDPEVWVPYAPSELLPTDMSLWSYGNINFHKISVDKSYSKEPSVLDYFV